MALEWMPREGELKIIFCLKKTWCRAAIGEPMTTPPAWSTPKNRSSNPFTGEEVPDLYVAEVRLNNPRQYNSYTTTMVKGVIAGFRAASGDRSVVATVFTGTGFDLCLLHRRQHQGIQRILLPPSQ
jgi:6-oxo-cyclohex-1-ene-carbonyl-CoA hydrolase